MMKTGWFLVACAICVSPAVIAAQDLIKDTLHAEAAPQATAAFESGQDLAANSEGLGWAPLLELVDDIEYTTPSPAQIETLLETAQDLDGSRPYTEELAQAPLLDQPEPIQTLEAAAPESVDVASADRDAADSDPTIPDDMTGREVIDQNGELMGTIINVDYVSNIADVELTNGSVLGLMMDTLTEMANGVVAAELTCEDAFAAAEQ
jgi:hypothetical protein